jgi:hypothetical protein
MEEFDLSGTYNLNVENAQPALGELQIAGVDIPDGFNGFYFTDIPLRIQAIPKPGYQFSGWSGDISSSEDETFISNYHLENLYKEYNVVLWHAIGSDLLVKGNDGFNPIQRKWTRGTFIWNNFNFLIIPRNGYPTIDALLPKQSIVVRSEFSGSSTDVRAAISKGELFRHLVDQETYNIIVKKNLYK